MDASERKAIVDEFNDPSSDVHVLVASMLGGAATGLNLQTCCSDLIIVAVALNINTFLQTLGRLHRMGQLRFQRVWILTQDHSYDQVLQHKQTQKMLQQIAGEGAIVVDDNTTVLTREQVVKCLRHVKGSQKMSEDEQMREAQTIVKGQSIREQSEEIIRQVMGQRSSRAHEAWGNMRDLRAKDKLEESDMLTVSPAKIKVGPLQPTGMEQPGTLVDYSLPAHPVADPAADPVVAGPSRTRNGAAASALPRPGRDRPLTRSRALGQKSEAEIQARDDTKAALAAERKAEAVAFNETREKERARLNAEAEVSFAARKAKIRQQQDEAAVRCRLNQEVEATKRVEKAAKSHTTEARKAQRETRKEERQAARDAKYANAGGKEPKRARNRAKLPVMAEHIKDVVGDDAELADEDPPRPTASHLADTATGFGEEDESSDLSPVPSDLENGADEEDELSDEGLDEADTEVGADDDDADEEEEDDDEEKDEEEDEEEEDEEDEEDEDDEDEQGDLE